jgi:hypothetical protein
MNLTTRDRAILRPLAERYSELAHLDVQRERIDRYYRTIAREEVRPVVLIDEVPWGEIDDEVLRNRCDPSLHWIEGRLRRALYQWDHFQVDLVIPPVFRTGKHAKSTGIGLTVEDVQIKSETGTYAASHEYSDQLADDEGLAKLELPVITFDKAATDASAAVAREVFDGLMPVEITGSTFGYNIWDSIAMYRGVQPLLMDLAVRPDFMHRTARRFMEIGEAIFTQMLALDLLDTKPMILHCTPACAAELPAADFTGTVRRKDVWGRCSAQIFGSVSPSMHDEFDLVYNEKLFGGCGLVYYGCCEPMDTKIDLLRKRFPTLRKISITPWANPERAAAEIGRDFVLAAKPNPAFVNSPRFNPTPVEAEIARYIEACRSNGTTCEFVLKDVSTIAKSPANLTQWAETVRRVIDRYY